MLTNTDSALKTRLQTEKLKFSFDSFGHLVEEQTQGPVYSLLLALFWSLSVPVKTYLPSSEMFPFIHQPVNKFVCRVVTVQRVNQSLLDEYSCLMLLEQSGGGCWDITIHCYHTRIHVAKAICQKRLKTDIWLDTAEASRWARWTAVTRSHMADSGPER